MHPRESARPGPARAESTGKSDWRPGPARLGVSGAPPQRLAKAKAGLVRPL